MSSAPTGIILTGGESTRMGRDKAFVVVDGAPMLVRVADALWEAGCHPVQCQGGDLAAIAELGFDAFPDAAPGAGPVGAIADALRRVDGPIVVAACDLAELDAAAVGAVIAAGATAGVAVAVADGHRHLLSHWTPAAADALRDPSGDGARSYREALDRAGAVEVAVAPGALRNVNRPGDLV